WKKKMLSIDTETTGLNPWKGDQPFAVCFYWSDDKYEYFEGKVDVYTRAVTFPEIDMQRMQEILNTSEDKWFHNRKFDQRMLENIGLRVSGPVFDTYLAAKA